ncbi:uncharacterized protein [Rutidosis leptorrhynchoides]|uniref:uncharacterized protein n=1 Tax=Rutidosis leptorrhynchoides TaxID=125765 RepID=UPI003A996B42
MDRIALNESTWMKTWEWIRLPNRRTHSELEELQLLLNNFKFEVNKRDCWSCSLHSNGLFSTPKLTHLIDEKLLPSVSQDNVTMRNNLLPQKIGLFIWRAIRNHIPIRTELDKRGIDLDSLRCPVCDEETETVEHILPKCSYVSDLWDRVFRWWQMRPMNQVCLDQRFKGFKPTATTNAFSKIWQAIEWTCGYVIWQNRNRVVFQKKKESVPMALNEVQIRSFEWITNRSKKLNIDWHQWFLKPNSFDDKGQH